MLPVVVVLDWDSLVHGGNRIKDRSLWLVRIQIGRSTRGTVRGGAA